ncbi:MAG TPA: superoxide dismutase family protein [Terriglobales bacterium]|jgi:Cu-Zn family superoxide dismutase|nr:superoxide dismutase family protein [Terriglobales bacterium]
MKHKRFFVAVVSSTIVLWSLASAAKTVVEMKDAQGKSVGTVTIAESGTGEKGAGVELDLNLHDLPPGKHGIHFHQNAKCDGPDFKSAGPHFNPDGKKHGLQNPDGHHAGDMMNFSVDQQGAAKLKMTDDDVVLGDGSNTHSLFSNGGTALVIHAKEDDMKTDPSGNSGDRIACGTVTK